MRTGEAGSDHRVGSGRCLPGNVVSYRVSQLLSDGDYRAVGVGPQASREDRGVGDTQSGSPVHAPGMVDHRLPIILRAHTAGARWVEGCRDVLADPVTQRIAALPFRDLAGNRIER